MSESIKVGPISELSEDEGKLVQAGGKEIAVFRKGDKVYAFSNVCPHQGGPLAEGMVDGEDVICPWHAWTFNMRTGESPLAPGVKIEIFPVRIEGTDVYVEV